MRKGHFRDKIVWLTGASSGIGYAILVKLIELGARVIATSRNVEALRELQKINSDQLYLLPADVTDIESLTLSLNSLPAEYAAINLVILNAGNCWYLDIKDFDVSIIKRNFDVNFFGVANCIQSVLPILRRQNSTHIVGVASAAAYVGLPRAEGYGSSKAAVYYLLESLQADLYRDGIDVSIVCPGFVSTALTARNDFSMPFIISADKAASIILNGIEKKSLEISFPWRLSILFKLLRYMPNRLRVLITKNLVKK